MYILGIILHVHHNRFCERIKNLLKRWQLTVICLQIYFYFFNSEKFWNFPVNSGKVSIFMRNIYPWDFLPLPSLLTNLLQWNFLFCKLYKIWNLKNSKTNKMKVIRIESFIEFIYKRYWKKNSKWQQWDSNHVPQDWQ